MRRDPIVRLLFVLLLLLGGLAWLTRHPDSQVLDRLATWPAVGPLAERFRAAYRRPVAGSAPPAETESVLPSPSGTRPPAAAGGAVAALPLRRIWIRPGTELRQAPAAESPLVATVPSFTRMDLLESRGGWARVRRVVLGGRPAEGWVRVGELNEPTVDELWRPDPALPLPASPPDPELLATARELMNGDGRDAACGPYRLVHDLADPGLPGRCARLADELEQIYTRRYGLRPAGPPAEAIVIFGSRAAYLLFRARSAPESRRHAFAAPAAGLVALTGERGITGRLHATLAHELAHLLNRRYLGPALPPWLDEGLAEAVAMSRFEADGTPVPGSLAEFQWQIEETTFIAGGEVELARLRQLLSRGELPRLEELVGLDRAGFQGAGRFSLHYTLSAFWVRHLLRAEPSGAPGGFRAFLGAVASGEALDEELLLGRLGQDWDGLEVGFRGWLAGTGDA